MLDILLFVCVVIAFVVGFSQKRKYEKSYHYIHQGIVNQFGTMTVTDLNNVILKQFYYYSWKNEKTPLVVKYNIIILIAVYIVMIKIGIFSFRIHFFSILFSIWLLLTLSMTIIETYMYRKISQEYTDNFWQRYIDNNKENKLRVVVHYAYTPREVSHLRMLSCMPFVLFIAFFFLNYVTGR